MTNIELSDADIETAFTALIGRAPAPEERTSLVQYTSSAGLSHRQLISVLLSRGDFVRQSVDDALGLHVFRIHAARVAIMVTALPPGRRVLDLGGANAPLVDCGYPFEFEQMIIVDLPPEDRHEDFAGRMVVAPESPNGPVSILYADMASLGEVDDSSIDLVWSGQSIEHVTRDHARRVLLEAARVLRPDGWLCLDTPNRLLTAIHAGEGYIHPEHKYEYTPAELMEELEDAGFDIVESLGVCDMPYSSSTGRFDYRDFVVGAGLTRSLDTAYIQYHRCRVKYTDEGQ